MEENNIYAFADQRTLNYAIESIRKTMARELALAGQAQYPAGQIFAKVGTLRDGSSGKQASASQVVWNYTTREFQAKSTGQWIWDSTADQDDIFTTTDIFCDKAMVANEVVEVRPLSGVTGDTDQWFATKSGSSDSIYTFKITTVNSPLDYTGNLIKSEADETVISDGTGKTLLIQGGSGEALEVGFILLVRRVETDVSGIYRPVNLVRLL